ncbi:AAA family ATPase [Homoserinimonas sp. OAct 916]|uniref:AAA family ATPase n=1 Tax=Homoserinimonas sp. OAct 916 TaxID=2211450 RepID=UPI000DBE43E0|nr:AAA family ATPase [Homoserinimonas sp. OAct 916]
MTEKRTLSLTPASQILSRKQRFAWENFIPLGTVTTFAGRGGEGKSSFCLWLGSQIQAGKLAGDLEGKPAAMLIVGPEDDWETVMKPRLVAAGADLDTVYKLGVHSVTDERTRETVPALPLDVELIRQAILKTDAKIVMIDPITATIGGDLHKVSDVRQALDPLVSLAQETDTAIITIMHFNKGAGNVSDKISGSHAFRDASRSVLLFATDEETGQRIVTLDKSNYSKGRGDSFAFNLQSVTINTDDGEQTEVAAVEYLGETELSVSDIVNRGADDGSDSDRADAQSFILEVLLEQGGSAKAREVMAAGKTQGYSESQVNKARAKAGAKSKRIGFGANSSVYWIHPEHELDAIDSPIDSIDSRSRVRESMESMESMAPEPALEVGENVTPFTRKAAPSLSLESVHSDGAVGEGMGL